MTRLSLQGRVTLATVAVLGVALAGLMALFNVLLADRLQADVSGVLHGRASAQLTTLVVRAGRVRPLERPNDAVLDNSTWVFAGGPAIEHPTSPAPDVARAARELAGGPEREVTVGSTRLLAVPVRERGGRRAGTVVVTVSLVPYRHSRHIAVLAGVVLAALLLLGAALAVRSAVRAALRPVGEMTARAADWSAHDLHRRFDMGPPRDELTGLAATFDGLLRRIEAVLRHEQQLSAEIAHELRTPLSGVRGEAELSLARPELDAEARDSFERVLEGTRRMQTVIETLLSSARAAGDDEVSSDPLAAMRLAVDAVSEAAAAREVEINLRAPGETLAVDAAQEFVTRAIQPLLENGVRHAASRVSLSLVHAGGKVAVVVEDDGPGLDGRDPEELFQPGVSTSGGAGLGLSLARRLARACGGDVGAATAAVGARFELRLPGGRRS